MADPERWNPLRREGDAFRAVIGALVYFALIVLAAKLGGTWAGLAVFLVLSACAVWLLVRRLRRPPGSA